MPEISVIVPVYNVEPYLNRCVDSILGQTFEDFELILVDDGSKDGSDAICSESAFNDSCVIVIQKINTGVSDTRNKGIDQSVGNYIVFVDSDDYVENSYLSNLYYPGYDMVITGVRRVSSEGKEISCLRHTSKECNNKDQIDYAYMYKNNMLYSPCCRSFDGRIIRRYNLKYPNGISWGEDGMFVSDYLEYVNTVKITDSVDYNYVIYNSNKTLSSKVRKDVLDTIVVARQYCVNKMERIRPNNKDEVAIVCENDIIRCCAEFVVKLFSCKGNWITRARILKHYESNGFFINVSQSRFLTKEIEKCLSVNRPIISIVMYDMRIFSRYVKKRMMRLAYNTLYSWQPKFVKMMWRKIKTKMITEK